MSEETAPAPRRARRRSTAGSPGESPGGEAPGGETPGGEAAAGLPDEAPARAAAPPDLPPVPATGSVSVLRGGIAEANVGSAEVRLGGIGRLRADDVFVQWGGVGAARADRVSVEFGSVGAALAGELRVTQGGAGSVLAREATVEQGFVRTLVAQRVTVTRPSAVLVMIAQHVSGEVRPLLDWRGALAAGAALGVVTALLRGRRQR